MGPDEWFGGCARVMFVHAHPDDETITTGGTLAALAEGGREPLLVTLTRGEQGEVVEGPLQALVAQHGIAVVRQNELANALSLLAGGGIGGAAESGENHAHLIRHAFLGVPPARAEGLSPTIYEDSGMQWMPDGRAGADDSAGPDALTKVPAFEAVTDLLTAANEAGARAIVSYDDGGGYGHPDHVFAHRAARAVAHALELPFYEIVDPGSGDPASTAGGEAHDVGPWIERKIAALRAYQTQLSVVPDDDGELQIVHVGGQPQPIARVEHFRLVGSAV